jgi:1-deoxy-D-xylulose-5-phosphate reductoisomerase
MPTVLNAANEVAVDAFMAGRIGFYGISDLVDAVCSASSGKRLWCPSTVQDALAIDEEARAMARLLVPEMATAGETRARKRL